MPSSRAALRVTETLLIPAEELHFSYIRAAGPGGQHVNKTSSAVQLRFDVVGSGALSEPVRQRLIAAAGNRMTRSGELVLTARRFRSREQNRQDALQRLRSLLRRASVEPRKRRRTRLPEASRRKRLEEKKRRATAKRLRARPSAYD